MACKNNRHSPFKPSTLVLCSAIYTTLHLLPHGDWTSKLEEFTTVIAAVWLRMKTTHLIGFPQADMETAK